MGAKNWDQQLLVELTTTMADASICGLGQAAQNPIKSVIKHFQQEI
jgi:formate dehydrogenase